MGERKKKRRGHGLNAPRRKARRSSLSNLRVSTALCPAVFEQIPHVVPDARELLDSFQNGGHLFKLKALTPAVVVIVNRRRPQPRQVSKPSLLYPVTP